MSEFSSEDSDKSSMPRNTVYTPEIFAINSKPYGFQYGEWTGKWWQWALSIPKDRNPLIDSTGEHCAEGQNGPVWFLAGTTGKMHWAERRCIIPSGKAILFPILVSQFSYSEVPSIKTDEELISNTAKDIAHWSLLEATIDGLKLHDLDKYRIQFGPFDLSLPENNIWNIRAGSTKAASDGFWVFLKPLTVGDHTVNFHGIEPHFETEARYHLTIKSQT
jgi:hypothetical protein